MIAVLWSEVPSEDRNGLITHYEVQFLPLYPFEGGSSNGSNFTQDLSIVLSGLEEFVEYDISVRAHNSAGPGPYSDSITVRTFEDRKLINFLLPLIESVKFS